MSQNIMREELIGWQFIHMVRQTEFLNHEYIQIMIITLLFFLLSNINSVCLISDDSIVYFDSFARKPPEIISKWLHKNSSTIEINKIQVQSTSSRSCGLFCCIFLVLSSRGLKLNQILSNFSPTLHNLNEIFVDKIINNECENRVF